MNKATFESTLTAILEADEYADDMGALALAVLTKVLCVSPDDDGPAPPLREEVHNSFQCTYEEGIAAFGIVRALSSLRVPVRVAIDDAPLPTVLASSDR